MYTIQLAVISPLRIVRCAYLLQSTSFLVTHVIGARNSFMVSDPPLIIEQTPVVCVLATLLCFMMFSFGVRGTPQRSSPFCPCFTILMNPWLEPPLPP